MHKRKSLCIVVMQTLSHSGRPQWSSNMLCLEHGWNQIGYRKPW